MLILNSIFVYTNFILFILYLILYPGVYIDFLSRMGQVSYMSLYMKHSLISSYSHHIGTVSYTAGDRSQIATIALAASKNPFGVVLGGLIGHAFCTGLAVIGGKMLAAKISERTVAIIGGLLFLVFGVTSIFFGPEDIIL